MTAAVETTQTGPTSLLARQLTVRLRPEFAVEVIVPGPDDPVLGTPVCGVRDCARTTAVGGLCQPHHNRWRAVGRPDLAAWTATADPGTRGRRPLAGCAVAGCQRGVMSTGLCTNHHYRWSRMAGRPELTGWLATVVAEPEQLPVCAVGGCALAVESDNNPGLCRSHLSRWNKRGRPPLEWFLVECATFGDGVFDLRALPMPLRLEIGYGLQCRHDDRRTKTLARPLKPLLGLLATSGSDSLLERPVDGWMAEMPVRRWGRVPRSFLRYTIERLEDLLEGQGWDAEFARDIWLLRRLGYPDVVRAQLRFDRIGQPWLRELAKRWIRWRLSAGRALTTVDRDLAGLTRLSRFLTACEPNLSGPAELDRPVLERYLAWLAVDYPSAKGRGDELGSVAGFLRGVHQHGWAPELPATAAIHPHDRPRRPKDAPRAISEHVMAQLESPANLTRFGDPGSRLLTEILMRTGLRIGDACQLTLDCVVRDPAGAAYLRYRNHKMRREAFVPIDEDLADAIAVHQAAIIERWPDASCLFPRDTGNPDGTRPVTRASYVRRLNRWLETCEIRDELSRPVHVTPHQWRHTYATRLVNAEVPLEVVRRLLDHTSLEMTAHYGRLHDRTVREQWEQARKVNIAGEQLVFDPTSPLTDATWLKDRLARAKMALPNGYCTLPLQQHCEVANACLTCPMFVTTAEFLPQHQQQLTATQQLIAQAEQHGQQRMAEMNRTVETNLQRIITSLEEPKAASTPAGRGSTGRTAHAG